jgi:F0F1-type ATP synthase delta subunit
LRAPHAKNDKLESALEEISASIKLKPDLQQVLKDNVITTQLVYPARAR